MKEVVAAGLLMLAGTANAQSQGVAVLQGVTSTYMHGRCSTLITAGNDVTPACNSLLVNVDYPTGGSSFWFTLNDKAIVSFFGRDSTQVSERGMRYLQRVSFRDSTPGMASSEVSGVCKFNNPYSGPTVVDCEADSKDGPFKAVFVTDGERPTVTRQ